MGFFDTSPLARLALMAQQQAGIGGMSGMSGPTGPQPPQNPTFQGGGAPVQPSPFQQPDMQQDAPPQDSMPRPDVPRSQPSRLQQFGQGLLNTIAPQPGQAAQSLLGPDAIRQAQRQSLLALGATLLTQGGASARPINIGEALGHGLLASQQTYNTALTSGVNQALTAESRNALATERLATTDNIRAQQMLRQQDLDDRRRSDALGPQYIAANAAGGTPRDIMLRKLQIALDNNDFKRVNEIRNFFTAGGVYATDPNAAGKETKLDFRANMGGRSVGLDPLTGKVVQDYGPAKPDVIGGGNDAAAYKGQDARADMNVVNKATTEYQKQYASFDSLEKGFANYNPESGNSAEQLNLMYKFIQSRDKSTVRQGEIALLKSGSSAEQQLAAYLDGVWNGRVLPAQMIPRLLNIMRRELKESHDQLQSGPAADALDRLKAAGRAVPRVDRIINTSPDSATTAPTGLLGYRRGGLSETVKGLITPKKP